MSRITVPSREAAPAATQPLLDAVEKQLGVVPNLYRLIALSPPVLQGVLGLSGALAKTLNVKTRERISDCPRRRTSVIGSPRRPRAPGEASPEAGEP